MAGFDLDVLERFWAKVNKTDTCWLWTASLDTAGYGLFRVNRKLWKAHRFSYELHIGPIPAGLVLDHVKARGCTHTNCVNPAHLEPVTSGENTRRGDLSGNGAERRAFNLAKTHCPAGHPYAGDNLYLKPTSGGRICRTCMKASRQRYQERQRV
jgi:hypothetical protein